MSLQQRIKKIEREAAPLIKAASIERCRRVAAKFGMCKILCGGSTQAEALSLLSNYVDDDGLHYFNEPHIFELFQSFLDADAEAMQLYAAITGYRREGVKWSDTLDLHTEQIAPLVTRLRERSQAYFMEHYRADYGEYIACYIRGRQSLEGKNEQSTIKSRKDGNGN